MKGYLFAIGIGYVIGTLWAPRKGSELRKDIVEHFEAGKSEVVAGGQQIISKAIETGEGIIDEAESRYNNVSNSVNQAKKIAKQSISNLGENLSEIAEDGSKIFSAEAS